MQDEVLEVEQLVILEKLDDFGIGSGKTSRFRHVYYY
jgi:hypothetical protein